MNFAQKIYSLINKIPKGRITTYKQIAIALKTKAYRAIGQALKKNPCAPQVPCHRVVCGDGRVGGYQGKNSNKKIELLKKEGIIVEKGKINDFKKKFYRF